MFCFGVQLLVCQLRYSTFKFELHQQSLALFNQNKCNKASRIECIRTRIHSPYSVVCHAISLSCCHPTLPHTFKHSCHDQHPLTLTRSPIKDHSDDDDSWEYYCDLCEERRYLQDPIYYCEECHYVTHISCVFDEILPLLKTEWSLAQDVEIVMLQAEVDALTTKSGIRITNLYELKEKHAQHISDYQVGVMEVLIKNAFLSATRHDPAIAKANEEIIMLQAEVDALTAKLETVTTKLDELMEKRVQHISDYQVGVMEVEIKIASTSAIARAEEEIIVLQAEVDAVTAKLQTVTTKLDEHKERREQHIGIPSLGTNSSSAVLDDFDEVVEEDSNAESEEDHESDTTLAELNKEIEAITAKLEALKKTRARHVSGLKLK